MSENEAKNELDGSLVDDPGAGGEAKKIVYIDMDNVLVDFATGIKRISIEDRKRYAGDLDEVPGIFALMGPVPGAIEAYKKIAAVYDTYILSTAPWKNPSAWSDKLLWVQKYLGLEEGTPAWKRLNISHHKDLLKGDYLIDDRKKNGADKFGGTLLLFGPDNPYPDWNAVLDRLGLEFNEPCPKQVEGLEVSRFSKEASQVIAVELGEENFAKVVDWIEINGGRVKVDRDKKEIDVQVHTNEEWMKACLGDWVVYEPYSADRPFYTSQPIIFTQAYNPVD